MTSIRTEGGGLVKEGALIAAGRGGCCACFPPLCALARALSFSFCGVAPPLLCLCAVCCVLCVDVARASRDCDLTNVRLVARRETSERAREVLVGECLDGRNAKKNKTPRAREGQRWRPDSSCWSWRRSTWPRIRAQSASALTAQMKAQHRHRCDCHPERPPDSPPGLVLPSSDTA
eukprot:scaffold16271_cov132-Isochrysis_galbana.AAC.5